MAQPTPYDRQNSFALFSAENPGEPHSGTTLDAEFNAVKVALDETQSNLALIQDDDGRLARASVGRDQLDSSITIGFESPTPWETGKDYSEGVSTVFQEAIFYTCIETHTSSVSFDPSKWFLIADLSVAAALPDGGVTEAKIADGAVTPAKLATNAVSTSKLASSAVSTPKIQDQAINTDKLAANAVTSEKVDASIWSTGDGRLTLRTAAAAGWVLMDDGTIGDASSGASSRANVDCEDLFTLIYNNISDTYAPILTSAGGATTRAAQVDAATAWAAHCRVSLTKQLGRAIGIAGAGSSLTSRALGQSVGAETHTLTTAESAAHAHAQTAQTPTFTFSTSPFGDIGGGQTVVVNITPAASGNSLTTVADTTPGDTVSVGGGGAHNNMQPTSFWNIEIKL